MLSNRHPIFVEIPLLIKMYHAKPTRHVDIHWLEMPHGKRCVPAAGRLSVLRRCKLWCVPTISHPNQFTDSPSSVGGQVHSDENQYRGFSKKASNACDDLVRMNSTMSAQILLLTVENTLQSRQPWHNVIVVKLLTRNLYFSTMCTQRILLTVEQLPRQNDLFLCRNCWLQKSMLSYSTDVSNFNSYQICSEWSFWEETVDCGNQ